MAAGDTVDLDNRRSGVVLEVVLGAAHIWRRIRQGYEKLNRQHTLLVGVRICEIVSQ